MAEPTLAARLPLDPKSSRPVGQGLVVTQRAGLGLATVQAHRGGMAALRERLRDGFGIDLPDGPRRTCFADVALIGTDRETWLMTADTCGETLAALVARRLAGCASVTDQSSAYLVLRLAGPHVRDVLARGVFVDLHPDTFGVGDAAVTPAFKIGAILWRLADRGGQPVFEMAVARSFADSVWHGLARSAAEFGLSIDP